MTSEDMKAKGFFEKGRNRLAIFLVLGVSIAGMVLSPLGSVLTGPASSVAAQEMENNHNQPQIEEEEQFMDPTAAAVDMNSNRIIVSGSAASPGDEAGPFQILQILPERMDGKVYSGWISFTASAPIYVIPGFGFDAENQSLNHEEYGELIRFPTEASFANNTLAPPEIAHGPILPQFGPPISMIPEGSLPQVYSASIPFMGDLLEVGNVNGTKFLITYTVIADVYETTRVSALAPAFVNTTGQMPEENRVSIVYGAVEKTNDSFSPNPVIIDSGENVTWVNNDFLPHTVTSGTPDQMDSGEAGQQFDSGFIGTRSSFIQTFEDTGQFEYFCLLHPNMVGSVIVR